MAASFIKSMLGSKEEQQNTEQQANALARIEELEQQMSAMSKEIEDLKTTISTLLDKVDALSVNKKTEVAASDDLTAKGISAFDAQQMPPASTEQVLYFSAPTLSGEFVTPSLAERSETIYKLTTSDDVNGQFVLLNTPDAIATANISISQFVKPACKVLSTAGGAARTVEIKEEGTAVKTGDAWKVTKKAIIEFHK